MNKIDFIGFIEVRNSNPNGDIDMDNQPRQHDDGYGYMTDVCLKRKIRDSVALLKEGEPRYNLYIANDEMALESKAMSVITDNGGYERIKEMAPEEKHAFVKKEFINKYFDVRAFGAVVTTFTKDKYLDGQIKGPVQITFADSIEEITVEQLTISRVAIQTEKDLKEKKQELGKKWVVPYAVYKFEGHISANVADKTGFNEEDKDVLLEAIWKMYENNKSSSSAGISMLKLFVFEHSSKYGDCNFRKLSNAIHVNKIHPEIGKPYYDVNLIESDIPSSIKVDVFE